jgi:lipopolysaccharide export system protein LptA
VEPTNEVDVCASNVSVNTSKRSCELTGEASVKYRQGSDSYVFNASRIVIYYDKNAKLKRINADGAVSFCCDNFAITAKACFLDTKQVVFEQDVVITNSSLGQVRADKAIYNIAAKKIDVAAETKVRVVVNDKKKTWDLPFVHK